MLLSITITTHGEITVEDDRGGFVAEGIVDTSARLVPETERFYLTFADWVLDWNGCAESIRRAVGPNVASWLANTNRRAV